MTTDPLGTTGPSATSTTYLLDVNVLLALTNPAHVHHRRVRTWFDDVSDWATCPITEAAFARLMLNPVIAGRRATFAEVSELLAGLGRLPGHVFLSDAGRLVQPLVDTTPLVGHLQVTDFHLVNLAMGHGAVLATLDARLTHTLAPDDRRHCRLV